MNERQLAFTFPSNSLELSQTQPISPDEHPEPLSKYDRESFTYFLTQVRNLKKQLEKVREALSIERMEKVIRANKGGEYFDGTQFKKEKQEPVLELLGRLEALETKLIALLDADPPPSRNHKTTTFLEITELFEDLKRWENVSKTQ